MRPVTTILCPLLIGRDEILELADHRIEEVAAGHGQILLITGQAGIGKSRFLDAIQRKAAARGFAASGGDVAPQDQNVPASPIPRPRPLDAPPARSSPSSAGAARTCVTRCRKRGRTIAGDSCIDDR